MDEDPRREFLQQIAVAVELHGLPVGDKQSELCLEHSARVLSCRGCQFEPGCATYATVIWNMWVRLKKGLKVDQEALDAEIQKQVDLAKSGIIPMREDL